MGIGPKPLGDPSFIRLSPIYMFYTTTPTHKHTEITKIKDHHARESKMQIYTIFMPAVFLLLRNRWITIEHFT